MFIRAGGLFQKWECLLLGGVPALGAMLAVFSGFVAGEPAQVMANAGAQRLVSAELLCPIAESLRSGSAPVKLNVADSGCMQSVSTEGQKRRRAEYCRYWIKSV